MACLTRASQGAPEPTRSHRPRRIASYQGMLNEMLVDMDLDRFPLRPNSFLCSPIPNLDDCQPQRFVLPGLARPGQAQRAEFPDPPCGEWELAAASRAWITKRRGAASRMPTEPCFACHRAQARTCHDRETARVSGTELVSRATRKSCRLQECAGKEPCRFRGRHTVQKHPADFARQLSTGSRQPISLLCPGLRR
ncbi:uncharacterized protein B0I36DRAFT_312528 [Microdochium trichocladiopsis]|uniref:Uncharacterized protein n=1 Tax=Microdochium trichocladiopsis TaxID=1682393 RepID=A0A9P8YLN1_9PEZI|nr:uncharacterized protein B0I36DRAFT_312528 [Microdochium trichocladiopsis]KAH7041289.1 hypothetical protein B0I36DRAFT_312528 [Microdochium trichocladiopsis]